MSKIKAVYWDIGGVLSRTVDRAPRTRLAARFGMSYAELEELVFNGEWGRPAQRGEISAAEAWRLTAAKLGLPPEEVPAFRAEFFAGDVLDQHLAAVIRRLHLDYRTGVISNAMDDVRALVEGPWGLAGDFDALIFSAEVGVMKPDERIFRQALAALELQPEEAVFIDDFEHNVAAARALGISAIHFRDPLQALADLEAMLK